MIISTLMDSFYLMIHLFLLPFNVPGAPDDLANALPQFLEYIEAGKSFFNLVLPINIRPFFLIFSAIFSVRHGYLLLMWILRKIPLLNMK